MTAELFQFGQVLRICYKTIGSYALIRRVTPHYLHVVTSKGSFEALRQADVAPVQIVGRLVLHEAERQYGDQVWRDVEWKSYEGNSRPLTYCTQASVFSAKETRPLEILQAVFWREWGEPTPPQRLTAAPQDTFFDENAKNYV